MSSRHDQRMAVLLRRGFTISDATTSLRIVDQRGGMNAAHDALNRLGPEATDHARVEAIAKVFGLDAARAVLALIDEEQHPGKVAPDTYECDDCGTRWKYAIAASMCCSPLNDADDLLN